MRKLLIIFCVAMLMSFSHAQNNEYFCNYVIGDVNGDGIYNGVDIIYGVAFYLGPNPPICPPCTYPGCGDWYYCGDVNGSCSYNGLDLTYGVAYFKGGMAPMLCNDCPPTN